MDEHGDGLDSWLREPVQPLLPPPGAFERIRREARARRMKRVSLVAASAAVVVAAALLAVPRLAGISLGGPGPALPASTGSRASHSPTAAPSATPAGFTPQSVTFVGTSTGWLLGQAPPGRCGPATTCLLETTDGGRSWHRVSPPPAGPPDGSRGVSQVRFLNSEVGWAFGPQLWVTRDAGQSWTKISTHGMRVTALETRYGRVFAVWARCSGSGPGYAAGCDQFSVYTAPAAGGRWAQVPGAGTQTAPAGGGSAQLVLTGDLAGGHAYLLPPDGVLSTGTLAAGAVSAVSAWGPVTGQPAPCLPGPAQADGQPSRALLASNGPGLLLLCRPAPGQTGGLYVSQDGGATWTRTGTVPAAGTPTALSGTPSGATIVLATTRGIEISADNGATWHRARGASTPGGFAYAGMTTDRQGVAVPSDAHAVWLTYDGGRRWRSRPLG